MAYPGAYPPAPTGQYQRAIIAAPQGDPLGEALAAGLRNLGWQCVVTDQFAPYAQETRVCVVPLTPSSVNSPLVASAIAAPPAPLVPLLVGATQLPAGPWATQPVIFSGDPNRSAQEIVNVVTGVSGVSSAGATVPFGQPAAPSMPLGYGAPAAPSTPYGYPGGYPQPGGTQQYQPPAAPYMQPPAAAPKRRIWPWVLGGVAALLLVVCACGGYLLYEGGKGVVSVVGPALTQTAQAQQATDTPAVTATSGVPAGFTQYSDSTDGYSLDYPSSWQKTSANGTLSLADPSGAGVLLVLALDKNLTAPELNGAIDTLFKGNATGGTYSNVKGPTSVTLGGETWTQKSADITSSGETLHAVALAVNHGSKSYFMEYLATKADFASVNSESFQPMLQTFTFTS